MAEGQGRMSEAIFPDHDMVRDDTVVPAAASGALLRRLAAWLLRLRPSLVIHDQAKENVDTAAESLRSVQQEFVLPAPDVDPTDLSLVVVSVRVDRCLRR